MRNVSVCMNVLIGPVILGVREWFLVVVVLEIVPDTWRSRLHNQVISDGPILKQRKCKTLVYLQSVEERNEIENMCNEAL